MDDKRDEVAVALNDVKLLRDRLRYIEEEKRKIEKMMSDNTPESAKFMLLGQRIQLNEMERQTAEELEEAEENLSTLGGELEILKK